MHSLQVISGTLKAHVVLQHCAGSMEHLRAYDLFAHRAAKLVLADFASGASLLPAEDIAALASNQTLSSLTTQFAKRLIRTQCVCEWGDRDALFARLDGEVRRELGAGRVPPVQPFHAMAYPFSAELALAISMKCDLLSVHYVHLRAQSS